LSATLLAVFEQLLLIFPGCSSALQWLPEQVYLLDSGLAGPDARHGFGGCVFISVADGLRSDF